MGKSVRDISDEPLYKDIVKLYLETASVGKTARQIGTSEVRVRKVLLTEGLWSSDRSIRIAHYLEEGMSTEQIAEILHTTVKAVQQYLPYSRGIYNGVNLTNAAHYSAEYRERIRIAQEKVLKRKQDVLAKEDWDLTNFGEVSGMGERQEPKKEYERTEPVNNDSDDLNGVLTEQYPGIVCFRQLPEGRIKDSRIMRRGNGADIVRLHLELVRDYLSPFDYDDDGHRRRQKKYADYDEETRVLKSYGKVQYGETISRDILITDDLPLYALHYAIQRLFGWQNSHLHRFTLPPRRFLDVTDGNAGKWSCLAGVLFRSPVMNEEDEFWADDYEAGSFKTWIRKKYTGPYLSLCHGEGIMQCTEDMDYLRDRYPLIKVYYTKDGDELMVSDAFPAERGETAGPLPVTAKDREVFEPERIVKKEILNFEDCPIEVVQRLFLEGGADYLLERLTIGEVLAMHGKSPEDDLAEGDVLLNSFDLFMDEDLEEDIDEIIAEGLDYPDIQPVIGSPTDVLYYTYDFGDNWQVRITGSLDACDLVNEGRVTQEELDEAICRVHETYRPVCIAADGLYLVDDAGGIGGYTRFLRAINPIQEKEYWGRGNEPDNWAYDTKQGSLEWARSLGWTDRINLKRML